MRRHLRQRGPFLLVAGLLLLSACQGGERRETRYPDGQLKSRKHFRTTLEGEEILHGSFTDYRPDGSKLLTGHYRNGKPQGTWRRYFETGAVARQWSYSNGKLDGPSTDWFPEGSRQHVVHYKRGVKEGKETVWFVHGSRQWEGVFENGALLSYRSYNVDGDLLEAYDNRRGRMEPEQARMWEKLEAPAATESSGTDQD